MPSCGNQKILYYLQQNNQFPFLKSQLTSSRSCSFPVSYLLYPGAGLQFACQPVTASFCTAPRSPLHYPPTSPYSMHSSITSSASSSIFIGAAFIPDIFQSPAIFGDFRPFFQPRNVVNSPHSSSWNFFHYFISIFLTYPSSPLISFHFTFQLISSTLSDSLSCFQLYFHIPLSFTHAPYLVNLICAYAPHSLCSHLSHFQASFKIILQFPGFQLPASLIFFLGFKFLHLFIEGQPIEYQDGAVGLLTSYDKLAAMALIVHTLCLFSFNIFIVEPDTFFSQFQVASLINDYALLPFIASIAIYLSPSYASSNFLTFPVLFFVFVSPSISW